MSAVLDPHTVPWYLANSKELSTTARTTIENAMRNARDAQVSAISALETVYLVKRQKLPSAALQRLHQALLDPIQAAGIQTLW
jgi:PIN domain nuclease of toxin-antitoxin system